MFHSVPIYFGNPSNTSSKVNNGTASLLKRGSKLFVATNHHVLAAFLERQGTEEGVRLSVGGLNVETISERVIFDDAKMDVSVFDFSDCGEADFRMFGNVPTQFHELGDLHAVNAPEKVVAFGGYPGASRVQVAVDELRFHTFSSGASVVEDTTESKIIVNIDHRESVITSLSPHPQPEEIGGLSGGPVFAIGSGLVATFRFAGIIAECNDSFGVMFATPVELFAEAFC